MRRMLAHVALSLYVVVRLYDMQGVPNDTLATARTTGSAHGRTGGAPWRKPGISAGVIRDRMGRWLLRDFSPPHPCAGTFSAATANGESRTGFRVTLPRW